MYHIFIWERCQEVCMKEFGEGDRKEKKDSKGSSRMGSWGPLILRTF